MKNSSNANISLIILPDTEHHIKEVALKMFIHEVICQLRR